jgi:ParB-like chromosome segregation protein Spo0J
MSERKKKMATKRRKGRAARLELAGLISNSHQAKFYDPSTPTENERLRDSIRREGQRDPILVRPVRRRDRSIRYEIIDGHRRVQQLKELGFGDVNAVILEDLAEDDGAALDLFLSVNRDRRQLSHMAMSRIEIARCERELGRPPGELRRSDEKAILARLTALLNCSPKNARRYFLILTKTPLAVQHAVELGILKLEVATKIVWLDEVQKEEVAMDLRGLTSAAAVSKAVANYVTPRKSRRTVSALDVFAMQIQQGH